MKDREASGKSKDTSVTKKAFFFLRHNNDIDHIAPVLYKWLSTENIPTDIIITSSRNLLNDYRIEYLKQFKKARIFFINDLFKKYSLSAVFTNIYFKYTTELDKLSKKSPFINRTVKRFIKKIADELFEGTEKGIVIFDWLATFFVEQMVEHSKNRGFTTISLPHGDRPYVSYLETVNELNYKIALDGYKDSNIFDYVVVPNNLCFKRHERYLEKERIKILGSPRYCDEWTNIISKFISPYKTDGDENKLKIVFFLRNLGYPIFWEEVVRTIKLIMQFPDVYLIVKHHPRNKNAKKLTKKLLKLYPELNQNLDINLKFIYESVNSSSLIKWADLILDLGTSATWEPIKESKPVLMPEYLYANYSTVAYYIKNSGLKCRDDLYDYLEKFTKNKNWKFYNEEERRKFIKEVIDVPDKNVLERYVKFLKSFLNNK